MNDNVQFAVDMLVHGERICLPGCIVECGVYQGDSLLEFAKALMPIPRSQSKMIYGFDSFSGLPEPSEEDALDDPDLRDKAKRGYFGDTAKNIVQQKIIDQGFENNIKLVEGWFEDALPKFDIPISFAFLDCDFYDSYVVCLKYLWPLLLAGGVIVLDEYDSKKYPGARLAVDEFFEDKEEKPQEMVEYRKEGSFKRFLVRKNK